MAVRGSGGDEKVYIAVGMDVNEGKKNLEWAVENFPRKRINIVHVLQLYRPISVKQGARGQTKLLERGRQLMREVLDKYHYILLVLNAAGKQFHIEKENIGEGIVELIYKHKIKRLVIGAPADKNVTEIKSKTSTYVHEQAPASCHIWFICDGHLIETREATGVSDEYDMTNLTNSRKSSDQGKESDGSSHCGTSQRIHISGRTSDRNGMFDRSSTLMLVTSGNAREATNVSASDLFPAEGSDRNGMFGKSSSLILVTSVNAHEAPSASASDLFPAEGSASQFNEIIYNSSSTRALESVTDGFYEKLQQAIAEAEIAKREAFEESRRRQKAESKAIKAEKMYNDERKQRKELQDAVAMMKNKEVPVLMEELNCVIKQKSLLEGEIADQKMTIEVLTEEMVSAAELLTRYKNDRDQIEAERDYALRAAKEPPYFICPILQEVMKEPYMTADGYTYEREAIREWFDKGNNTSPMTNLKLAHTNLVPNLALRSAIQEFSQHL